jgi:hypothetical protein
LLKTSINLQTVLTAEAYLAAGQMKIEETINTEKFYMF